MSEPQFVVRTAIGTHPKHPTYLACQIHSKVQRPSNPDKWYMSVAEFLEPEVYESPVFLMQVKDAAEFAKSLLRAVDECQRWSDEADASPPPQE